MPRGGRWVNRNEVFDQMLGNNPLRPAVEERFDAGDCALHAVHAVLADRAAREMLPAPPPCPCALCYRPESEAQFHQAQNVLMDAFSEAGKGKP